MNQPMNTSNASRRAGMAVALIAIFASYAFGGAATAPLRIVPSGGFEVGKYYEVEVRYPTNRLETLSFTTDSAFSYTMRYGNGSVSTNRAVRRVDITMDRLPGTVSFTPWHTSGSQRTSVFRLNAELPEATFATQDDPARAQEAAAARERRDWRR